MQIIKLEPDQIGDTADHQMSRSISLYPSAIVFGVSFSESVCRAGYAKQ